MNTRIVFSPSRRRPGCALLQVAMGGDVDSETFHMLFPVETWLVSPTDDMAAYPINEDCTLEVLSKIAHDASIEKLVVELPDLVEKVVSTPDGPGKNVMRLKRKRRRQ